jgi:hypothetical protein
MVRSWFAVVKNQREGMGLLEYQSMPSLRDGRLRTFTTQQELEIPSSHSWAAPVRATGTVQTGGTDRPSRTKSHLPGHSPPASLAGRCVGPASIAYGLIVKHVRIVVLMVKQNFSMEN